MCNGRLSILYVGVQSMLCVNLRSTLYVNLLSIHYVSFAVTMCAGLELPVASVGWGRSSSELAWQRSAVTECSTWTFQLMKLAVK